MKSFLIAGLLLILIVLLMIWDTVYLQKHLSAFEAAIKRISLSENDYQSKENLMSCDDAFSMFEKSYFWMDLTLDRSLLDEVERELRMVKSAAELGRYSEYVDAANDLFCKIKELKNEVTVSLSNIL